MPPAFNFSELWNRLTGADLHEAPAPERIDPLTRLPMRQTVVQRLKECLSKHHGRRPVALLIIDFANVQGMADSKGAGEADLLGRLARLMRSHVSDEHPVGHLRDREFAVILCDTPIQEAERLADRVIEAVREDESLSTVRRYIATSVGIGFSSKGDCTASDLMKLADIALHYALNTGSGVHAIVDRVPGSRAA